MTGHRWMAAALVGVCALCGGAWGAITAGGNTTLATDTTQNTTVGDTGVGTLSIDAALTLSNATGYVGYAAGSDGTATVSGAGSTWANSSSLYVGRQGAGVLIVEAGGLVNSVAGRVGFSAGSNGNATIRGTSSKWTSTGSIYIGDSGTGTLLLEDGGQMSNTFGYLGYSASGNGSATVRGAGSLWTNSSDSSVGYNGTGTLRIEGGGAVSSTSVRIGRLASAQGIATVTGGGSTWTTSSELMVGDSGRGTLVIEAGGQLQTNTSQMGVGAGSVGMATVSGVSSKWASNYSLTVGELGSGTLVIENGAQVNHVWNTSIGLYAGGSGSVTVRGGGSALITGDQLFVGGNEYGSAAGTGTLTVTDGATVSAKTIYASLADLAGNGTINVANGAVLDAELVVDSTRGLTQALSFGDGGTLNLTLGNANLGAGFRGVGSLRIADGRIVSPNTVYLGYHPGSTGTAVVMGAGTKLSAASNFYVGRYGAGTLTVSDGAVVSCSTLFAPTSALLGNGTINASGLVMDTDLVFDATHGTAQTLPFGTSGVINLILGNGGNLGAGYKGNGTLRIAGGVNLVTGLGYFGYHGGSLGSGVVSGAGTRWSPAGFLTVGVNGNGALRIEGGAMVSSPLGYVGNGASSAGAVTVTGAGSEWNGLTEMRIGYAGQGSVTVEAGGLVATSSGVYVGYSAGSSGVMTVRGLGSRWNNSGTLYLGRNGAAEMNVLDGARVTCTTGYIGYWTGSNAEVTVSGAGSMWTPSSILYVGSLGNGSLVVENGGLVTSVSGYVGGSLGVRGDVIVRGANAKWTISGDLRLGASASSIATARIEAGGVLSDVNGYIGYSSSSTAAMAVSGAGASWVNSGSLFIGSDKNATLTVERGGKVSCATAVVAANSTTPGTVVVRNAGSVWATSGALTIGQSGRGALTIADGGVATARSAAINTQSTLRLVVSGNGMLVLGNATTTGSITNNGTVVLYADPKLAAGVYTPISEYADRAMTWSGTGTYKAYGGTWSSTGRTFTAGAVTLLSPGDVDSVSSGERIVVRDTATGQEVGVSFGTISAATNFSARAMTAEQQAGLLAMLNAEQRVVSAWEFTSSFAGPEAMVSCDAGLASENVEVWRWNGTAWAAYTPGLVSYEADGGVGFTVSSFSGYAVVVSPEPGGLVMLVAGIVMLGGRRRRAR